MTNDERGKTIHWLREAMARHERGLVAYATRLLGGDADQARDVVQDTFLKLWEADRAAVDDHLSRWLFTVCRNRAFDVRRKEGRMTTMNDVSLESRTAAVPDEKPEPIAQGRMMDQVERLPERQQEVLRLKFQGELSYREIAEVMDTTVNNVGVMIHTAIKTLRERMDASSSAPGGVQVSDA